MEKESYEKIGEGEQKEENGVQFQDFVWLAFTKGGGRMEENREIRDRNQCEVNLVFDLVSMKKKLRKKRRKEEE